MTDQIPSHVKIMSKLYSTGSTDGLGTIEYNEPNFYGLDPGLTRRSKKLKQEFPHKGYIQSWAIPARNDRVYTLIKHSLSPAGNLSNDVRDKKDAGILWWYSSTPGGTPLITLQGRKQVNFMLVVEQVYKIYQRYSVNDPDTSKGNISIGGNSSISLVFPIINKTYYINFAGVSTATAALCATQTGNTLNPDPRAPTASELVNFPATDISGRSNLSFITTTSASTETYEDYIENVGNVT